MRSTFAGITRPGTASFSGRLHGGHSAPSPTHGRQVLTTPASPRCRAGQGRERGEEQKARESKSRKEGGVREGRTKGAREKHRPSRSPQRGMHITP